MTSLAMTSNKIVPQLKNKIKSGFRLGIFKAVNWDFFFLKKGDLVNNISLQSYMLWFLISVKVEQMDRGGSYKDQL